MYEDQYQAKESAHNQIRQGAIQGIGYAQSANLTSAPTPKILISEALLSELGLLLEKARMINSRQINLKDRIFGSCPQSVGSDKATIAPQGFLHEANEKIQQLQLVMDSITQNCAELERLA